MPYVLNTPSDVEQMLQSIGAASIEELFTQVPAALRLNRDLEIPKAMSELELTRHLHHLGGKNQAAGDGVCFLGGGSYDHFIPSVVDAVSSRSEFYTAYTPYQAEASQGSLQAFYEYQTLVCQLSGMDVSNASLYEGGSSVAEAVLMALNITERRGNVVIAGSVHPEYRQTLETYLTPLQVPLVVLPTSDGYLLPEDLQKAVNDQTAAVIFQQPNFFGHLEDVVELTRIAKQSGAMVIVSFDPISVGVMKRPGDYHADIAVAEGQSLGTPMGFGGPYLGIMACRQEFVRKIPGRLVGETTDRNGKRCWVLTLQTREQHIRRDKATSNICTNQGLFALRAAVFLTALGPKGLKETAEHCLQKAHFAAEQLCSIPGVSMAFNRPFFKEFALRFPKPVDAIRKELQQDGYFAPLSVNRYYPTWDTVGTVAVTEKRTKDEILGLCEALKRVLA
ncbi:MAG: aminomethyl-transferring glycine dehydrogenase subunit GcvPA [Zavarzinella sp.]